MGRIRACREPVDKNRFLSIGKRLDSKIGLIVVKSSQNPVDKNGFAGILKEKFFLGSSNSEFGYRR
jgi:hypothetical protein